MPRITAEPTQAQVAELVAALDRLTALAACWSDQTQHAQHAVALETIEWEARNAADKYRTPPPTDGVFEDDTGWWYCTVNGKVSGAWATRALAKAGLEVEQRRARNHDATP